MQVTGTQQRNFLDHPVEFKLHDLKWIPCSDKFVAFGKKEVGFGGIIQIFKHTDTSLSRVKEITMRTPLICGSFGASNLSSNKMAIGDCRGRMYILDLERLHAPMFAVKAHSKSVIAIDAIGGETNSVSRQIVTAGGYEPIKVWDPRQENPVIHLSEKVYQDGESSIGNCWRVAFGNSQNERTVAAGFGCGYVRVYDLRTCSVLWEKQVKDTIVAIEFDRKEQPMNKLVTSTSNGLLTVYDMKREHSEKEFAMVDHGPITSFNVKHMPQDSQSFVSCGEEGVISVWEYEYPAHDMGFSGSIYKVKDITVSSKTVHCFDWNPDRPGIGLCASIDGVIRTMEIC